MAARDEDYPSATSIASAPDGAPLPRARWMRTLVLVGLLAIAIYIIVPQIAALRETAEVLREMRWWAVGLAVVARTVSYWCYGYTLHEVARLTRTTISPWDGMRMTLAASSIGLVAGGPVGHSAAKYRWTRRFGATREAAVLCGWLPSLLNTVALVAATIAGSVELVLLDVISRNDVIELVVALLVLVAVIVAAFVASRNRAWVARVIGVGYRAGSKLRRRPFDPEAVAQAVERMELVRRLTLRGGWRLPLLGAVTATALDIATLAFLFLAARNPVTLAILLAGYAFPQVIGQATFLPGGLGIVEGGMVGMYVALGVDPPTAVLVVLAYRGVSFWLPTLAGFPFIAMLEHAPVRRSEPAPD